MFAVVFEVNPRPALWDEYLGRATLLRPELLKIDGFVANDRYASLTRKGWLVSLSIWRDEKALIRWRTHALHHQIQGEGRNAIFADYHLRVGEITQEAPPGMSGRNPVQHRFDVTETGAGKAISLTELPMTGYPVSQQGSATALDGHAHSAELVACESYESIARPGDRLDVMSWRSQAAAEAAVGVIPGRHRILRVIRDYGMFARAEAPQYYPDIRCAGRRDDGKGDQ